MSASPITFVIAAGPPLRLDKALARDVPEQAALSRTRLARLLGEGAVWVDGAQATNPKARVQEGAQVTIRVPQPTQTPIAPEDSPLDIYFEDADLIVLNKPAGQVVHPGPGNRSGTLVNALLHHCRGALSGVGGVKRPGIVHRIDKETSGLLVVAKSDAAHLGLAAQFKRHSVKRRYSALVYGVPEAFDPRLRGLAGVGFERGEVMRITTQLARHKTDRQRQAVVPQGGRHAVTRARVAARFGAPPVVAELTCWLETGRTHQIRVHMAHIGHGLIGDPTYGQKRKISAQALSDAARTAIASFPRQALHAGLLGFTHPISGEALEFEAEWPEDLAELRDVLAASRI